MPGMQSGGAATDGGDPAQAMGDPALFSLEFLAGPEGLPLVYPILIEGLNVVQLSLLDVNGWALWSTDPTSIGTLSQGTPLFNRALSTGVSSEFVRDKALVDLSGTARRIDVMKMYLPIHDITSGQLLGIIEIFRDVSKDVTIQVDDAKAAVLWTTTSTMGGLFLALFGFILVANVAVNRSSRREVQVVEEARQTLEDRVRERTQELLEAQKHVLRSEKLATIGQLAGSVAHDLRNPLGAINNAAYYLKKKLVTDGQAQANPRIGQFLQIMEDEVRHSNEIISDLLVFSRDKSLSLSPTNLGGLLEGTIARIEVRDGIRVVQQIDPDLPEVMADGERFQRVLLNLAQNGQDAMPDGGELGIAAWRVDGSVEVTFSDTGVGIGDADLKKVFEPLFTTKPAGTGLGLAICRQIVSKHGGSIDVTSVKGEGTQFSIKLPFAGDGSE